VRSSVPGRSLSRVYEFVNCRISKIFPDNLTLPDIRYILSSMAVQHSHRMIVIPGVTVLTVLHLLHSKGRSILRIKLSFEVADCCLNGGANVVNSSSLRNNSWGNTVPVIVTLNVITFQY